MSQLESCNRWMIPMKIVIVDVVDDDVCVVWNETQGCQCERVQQHWSRLRCYIALLKLGE